MRREIGLAFTMGLAVFSGAAFAQTTVNPYALPTPQAQFSPSVVQIPNAPVVPASDEPDYYFEEDVTNEYKVGPEQTVTKTIHQKMELKNGQMLKVDNPEENSVTIIRLDKKIAYQLDTNLKTYTESNFQALKIRSNQDEIRANQADPQKKSGQEAARLGVLQSMQGISPEQRAIMMQMMSKNMGQKPAADVAAAPIEPVVTQPVILAQTADFMDILGYKCQRVKFIQGNKKLLEAWVTDKTGPQNYLSAFIENFNIFNADLVAELRKVNGFPLQIKYRIQKGPLKDTIQSVNVTKIEQKELSPADFEVPADYKSETASGGTANGGKEESF